MVYEQKPGAGTLTSSSAGQPPMPGMGAGKQTRVEAQGPQSQPSAPAAVAAVGTARLGEMLGTLAPALGDPVASYLLSLPLPVLLDELRDAVACGYGNPLELRLASAPPILSAALQAAELALKPSMTVNDPGLHRTGVAIDQISTDQQVGILTWMLRQRGMHINATTLVEGAIAIRGGGAGPGADARGSAPAADPEPQGAGQGAAAGAHGASAGMPPPIEQGPWAPPGDQPGGLYVGADVHQRIGDYYVSRHRGQNVVTNDTPISTILKRMKALEKLSSLDESELLRRPDILNLDLRDLYEIKPLAAAAAGRAKVGMYTAILSKAGINVSPGPMSDPGAAGQLPAPAGTVMFECLEPGVITYQYRHSRLVPVPVPVPSPAPGPNWKWAFEKDLTPDQEKAVVTTTVGGAVLILLMVVLAPVGA